MKSTLAVVEWIWALRQQGQSDEAIEIEINEEIRKNGFNEQQIKDTFINAQIILEKGTAEPDRQRIEPSQQPQTSDMTNLLMQMLQNQQQQMNQMMTIFMNFAHTSSPTPTPPAALTTHTAPVPPPPMNDDLSYIKFPDLSLFNGNHNKYLVWKWKTLDKLLAEDWKYVKMGIQADYL